MRVEAPSSRHLAQLDTAVLVTVLGGECHEGLVNLHGTDLENIRQARGTHRLIGNEQERFDGAHQVSNLLVTCHAHSS